MQRDRDLAQQDLERYFGQERPNGSSRLFALDGMMQLLRDVRSGRLAFLLRLPRIFQADARGLHGPVPEPGGTDNVRLGSFFIFSCT